MTTPLITKNRSTPAAPLGQAAPRRRSAVGPGIAPLFQGVVGHHQQGGDGAQRLNAVPLPGGVSHHATFD